MSYKHVSHLWIRQALMVDPVIPLASSRLFCKLLVIFVCYVMFETPGTVHFQVLFYAFTFDYISTSRNMFS
jgi:hypothetical protein